VVEGIRLRVVWMAEWSLGGMRSGRTDHDAREGARDEEASEMSIQDLAEPLWDVYVGELSGQLRTVRP